MPEPFPIATMDAFAREFLPQCHVEADRQAVQARLGERAVPLIAGAAIYGMCSRGVLG